MENEESKESDVNNDTPRMRKMMKGFFTKDVTKDFKDMKDSLTKGLKRGIAVLVIVAFGWIIFVSLHSFLWSTSYTFYQNLVITFDSLIVAVLVAVGLIYKVSGLEKISKKLSKMTDKFTKNDED